MTRAMIAKVPCGTRDVKRAEMLLYVTLTCWWLGVSSFGTNDYCAGVNVLLLAVAPSALHWQGSTRKDGEFRAFGGAGGLNRTAAP